MSLRAATVVAGALAALAGPARAQPVDAGPPPELEAPEPEAAPPAGDADRPDGPEPGVPEGSEPPLSAEPPPPPDRMASWDVRGQFLEPPEVVRAFFAQRMAAIQVIGADETEELRDFAAGLGYDLTDVNVRRESGGAVHVELVLLPALTVFWVDVSVDNYGRYRDMIIQFFEQVFQEQIQRRMQIRQGDALPRDERERRRRLLEEQRRVEEYLRAEGFFDARVRINTRPRGEHAVTVEVDVKRGPRYTVGKITVVGNASISAREIASKFRHAAVCPIIFCIGTGRFRSEEHLNDIKRVEALYHERGYPGARVRTDFDPRHSFKRRTHTVEFTVTVAERRKVDVVFEGNDKRAYPDERLEKVLTLGAEGSYDDIEIENSAQAIRALYQYDGRFEAQVAWERESFGGVFDRIIFTIDEGPRLPVVSVTITGNDEKVLSDGFLLGKLATRPYRRVRLLGGGGGFVTRTQLEQDREAIASQYRQRGYADVKVTATVDRNRRARANAPALAAAVAAGLPSSGLYVNFEVDPGVQELVDGVRFEFDRSHGDKGDAYYDRRRRQLAGIAQLKQGAPYTEQRSLDDRKALERFYYAQGLPYARVETEARPGQQPERLTVVHTIVEGTPVRFGKVMVRGNFRTDNWVILDELGIEEGQPLTLSAAERAQQNLRNSGLFRTVNVRYVDLDAKKHPDVNVLVQVQESSLYDLEAGAGYSSELEWIILDGVGRVNNLFGDGIRSRLQLLWAQKRQAGEIRLELPRWIGRKMTFGAIGLTTDITTFLRREDTERFGVLLTGGTSLALTKVWAEQLAHNVQLGVRWDIRRSTRDEELIRPAGASEDVERAPVPTTTGAVGPVFIMDDREDAGGSYNPLAPQKGWYLELSASYADSFLSAPIEVFPFFDRGRDRFLKLGGSAQLFRRLNRRTALALIMQYDHGIPLGDEFLLPEVERFFAGGDTTVRGFDRDRLATEVIIEPVPPLGGLSQIRVLPAGGNIRALGTIDLQVAMADLWGIPLASAVFMDAGVIRNSWLGAEWSDIRPALGVALARLVAPFGNLSLEYAVPLNPRLGDDPRGRIHFNFGISIR